MGQAQQVFDQVVRDIKRTAPLAPKSDLRGLSDGRLVPLDWKQPTPPPVVDRGSPQVWD